MANTYGWGFVNINLRPYYSEGSKTLGYEVVEQRVGACQITSWRRSPLDLFTKIRKGFDEFMKVGLVEESPCALAVPKPRAALRSLRPLPKAATSSLR